MVLKTLKERTEELDKSFKTTHTVMWKHSQLEKGLVAYIKDNNLNELPRFCRELIMDIDADAIKTGKRNEGFIAQHLIRVALALGKGSPKHLQGLELKEIFLIDQIIYLYEKGELEKIYESLVSGSLILVEEDEVQNIINRLIAKATPKSVILFNNDIKTQTALKTLVNLVVYSCYRQGFSEQIKAAILTQKEDLNAQEISIDLLKQQVILHIVKTNMKDALQQRLISYIDSLNEEHLLNTTTIKKISNIPPTQAEIRLLIREVLKNTTDLTDETIDKILPLIIEEKITSGPSK